jgi:hypothetical protein
MRFSRCSAGIGSKKDSTGNSTLTSGLLDFHRILQALHTTHKDGSPAPTLADPGSNDSSTVLDDDADHRVSNGVRSALESASEGSAVAENLFVAMEVAAFVAGKPAGSSRRKGSRKRERDSGSEAKKAKKAKKSDTATAESLRMHLSYRRSRVNKQVANYSKHDLSAILGDASGAWRPPTEAEALTTNTVTRVGEGLSSAMKEAAEHLVRHHKSQSSKASV